MKDLKDTEFATIVREFTKSVGLNNPTASFTTEDAHDGMRLSLHFTMGKDRLMLSNKPYMQLFRELQGSILESPFVQREIKLVEDKLAMANRASDELLERIKELEKYKTHYELEMKLRHGDAK